MAVARRARVTVALDSFAAARALSDAAQAAQVKSGCSPRPMWASAAWAFRRASSGELASAMRKLHGLVFEGIAFYPGHIKILDEAGRRAMARLSDLLGSILADFRRRGIEVPIVSGGSRPRCFTRTKSQGLNEIRPGTYIFNDLNTVRSGACALEDCAASILATVVSTARPGTDDYRWRLEDVFLGPAGELAGGDFRPRGGRPRRAVPQDERGARLHRSDVRRCEHSGPGDRVRMIPNHICVAMNLHEWVYGVRGEHVEEIWNVDARGKVQ